MAICLLALSAIDWLVERGLRQEVAADLSILSARSGDDGLVAAIELMDLRSRKDGDETSLRYVLIEPESGQPMAGNLETWPVGFAMPEEETGSPSSRSAIKREDGLVGASVLLDGHFPAFVGRSIAWLEIQRQRGLFAIAILILSGLVIGLLIERRRAQRARERLSHINGSLAAYLQGDRSSRIRDQGGDTLGRLGGEIDKLLDLLNSRLKNYETIAEQIVHELRTPVARAVASGAERGGIDRQVGRELLHTIDRVASLAEITHGDIDMIDVHIDLLMEDVARLYADAAEDAGLTLRLACGPTVVAGDLTLLKQLVANLMQNAVRYSPSGGQISLACGYDAGAAFLSIGDTGPGLAGLPSEPGLLGNRGMLGAATDGWGIGLAICLRIADRHHATIGFADREAGSGLVVTVRFPAGAGRLD